VIGITKALGEASDTCYLTIPEILVDHILLIDLQLGHDLSSSLEVPMKTWTHPGGKLIEFGPSSLTDEELLAILIGTGYKNRTAQDIAKELMDKYYSIAGLMGKRLTELAKIKGLKDVKVVRIAAAFEIARRVVKALEKE
jgi:hypothetical protein